MNVILRVILQVKSDESLELFLNFIERRSFGLLQKSVYHLASGIPALLVRSYVKGSPKLHPPDLFRTTRGLSIIQRVNIAIPQRPFLRRAGIDRFRVARRNYADGETSDSFSTDESRVGCMHGTLHRAGRFSGA